MPGLLGFSRKDAVALPLTVGTVDTVIARTRIANLAQTAVWAGLVAGLVWGAGQTTGWVPGLLYGVAALGMWGLLAALLSTWDHFRTAAVLRRTARAEIAPGTDRQKFWRAHRGVFPYFSR